MKQKALYQTLYKLAISLYIALFALLVVGFLLFMRWEQHNGTCTATALYQDASRALSEGVSQLISP